MRQLGMHVNRITGCLDTSSPEVESALRVLWLWAKIARRDFHSAELNPILPTLTKMIGFSWIEEENHEAIQSDEPIAIFDFEEGGETIQTVDKRPVEDKSNKTKVEDRVSGGGYAEGGYLSKLIAELRVVKGSHDTHKEKPDISPENMASQRVFVSKHHRRHIWASLTAANEDFIHSVAHDILTLAQESQKKIPADDLACYPLSYCVNDSNDAIKGYSRFLNDLSRWVEVLVLSSWDPVERANVISFFILLIQRSISIRSYFVAMGLSIGLQSTSIQRFVCNQKIE